jgi:hypothetical protein
MDMKTAQMGRMNIHIVRNLYARRMNFVAIVMDLVFSLDGDVMVKMTARISLMKKTVRCVVLSMGYSCVVTS